MSWMICFRKSREEEARRKRSGKSIQATVPFHIVRDMFSTMLQIEEHPCMSMCKSALPESAFPSVTFFNGATDRKTVCAIAILHNFL